MSKLYSLRRLQEISNADEEFVQDMVDTFIESVSVEVQNIQKLMINNEWDSIAGIIHKLSSNFAYLDAKELQDLSVRIEQRILNHCDLTELSETTKKLCSDSMALIEELKKI